MSGQAPWPGALEGTVQKEWSGSFLISPGSQVSLPCLPACLPAGAQQPLGAGWEGRAQPEQLAAQGGGAHLARPVPP